MSAAAASNSTTPDRSIGMRGTSDSFGVVGRKINVTLARRAGSPKPSVKPPNSNRLNVPLELKLC